MPYLITRADHGFRVTSPHGVKAKHTTKAKAMAQVRLLQMKEHGITPRGGWRKTKAVIMRRR
jgi:hypothetical protein